MNLDRTTIFTLLAIIIAIYLFNIFTREGFYDEVVVSGSGLSVGPVNKKAPSAMNDASAMQAASAMKAASTTGVTSTNIVNGKSLDTALISAIENGIQNNPTDVAAATTAGVPLSKVGGVQQITGVGADSAAATIQNKPIANKAIMSPSAVPAPSSVLLEIKANAVPAAMPSAMPQAMPSVMPQAIPQAMPSAMPKAIPQAAMPQSSMPKAVKSKASMIQSAMPVAPKPKHHTHHKHADDCGDDCEDDCGGDCDQSDGFFNF